METNKSRIIRFNSFELSDSEQTTTMNLKSILFELQSFFPAIASEFSDIDRLIEESKVDKSDDDSDFKTVPLYKLNFVSKVRRDMRCVEALKSVRSCMEDVNARNEEITNWDLLVKDGFKVQSYLSFIYTLVRMFELNPNDKINIDVAFNAGRTYMCLLALPGAKRCLIWDVELVITYFKLLCPFDRMNKSSNAYSERYLEIQIIQMLNECRNVFNVVCLSDQSDVLENYIETLSNVLDHFMLCNKSSSHEVIMKCYKNLEALCLKPLPDQEIERTMYMIFCRTVDLHFFSQKRNSRSMNHGNHGESISDFFLYLLSTYAEKTKNVLLKFVKSLLSNLDHKYDREKQQKLFDVAVKYELAIYWLCNESLVEYLEKIALAADARIRLNGVEFCGKMLLIDSTAEEGQQPSPRIEIPREAFIIKILFEKVYDKQDNIKLKALNALKAAIVGGNEYCKNIFGIIFKHNLTEDNPEIIKVFGKEAEMFQNNLLSLLQTSQSTYIKKTCLEILSQHFENLLDNEIFLETISSLTDDGSYLVKLQLLEIVNTLLNNHSKNKNVLELWLEVVLSLITDNDNKIVDASIKSLTAIFQKIESFENTINDMQLLPWNIIRLIMEKGKRNLLQSAMGSVSTNFLSKDKLRKIETHIFTPNKSEAWCILSIIAKQMKSNNPDIVVKTFLDQVDRLNDQSNNSNDFHLVVEVIQNWTTSFNTNSKTQIATKLSQVLEAGSCSITMLHHLYEICLTIRKILNGKDDTIKFTKRLNDVARNYILGNAAGFAESFNDEKFLCFILLYCESNTDLPHRPDRKVIDFMFDFVRKILNDKLQMSLGNDVPRKLNSCIIVLTRFAVRDNELASEVTPDLAMLLRKRTMHISVTKTSMQCLNDLCKKHTSTVAPVFKEIIFKLHSQNQEIRLCALANIYDLVMQDFIKMKGRVLLNFLACLVDKNELIQLKSQAAILSYTNDKNQNLLYTCFLESVYLFNDFIQTENFGVFPLDEIDRNYKLLHGVANREMRYELYNFFVQNIHDMNEVHLLLLLKQIIVIKEKLEKDKFKKSASGVETFKDLLHIFKLICEKRGESKTNISKADNADYADNDEVEEAAETSAASKQKTSRKSRNTMTVNDALPVIEKMILVYPTFVDLMTDYDTSLQPSIHELTKIVAQNFPTFIEFSKPDSFWGRVQSQSAAKSASKKPKKGLKRPQTFIESDNDSE